jgi:uncharacterized protein YjbI with pentapeptide repeats
MNEKLKIYLNGIFTPYEDVHTVRDLKEELLSDLEEKMRDLMAKGHDEETAYNMTVESVGNISEIVEDIAQKTRQLKQTTRKDLSMIDLRNSDLAGVSVHDGKFNCSDLKGSDFSGADLKNSIFKGADLTDVRFDGADLAGAKFKGSSLKKASFIGCNLAGTDFTSSDLTNARFEGLTLNDTAFEGSELKGTSFKNAVIRNVSFRHSDVKKTVFDGASIDKLTYAVLKGQKADLSKVTVI